MNISEIKGAYWLPKQCRITNVVLVSSFLLCLVSAVIFALAIPMTYGTEECSVTTITAILLLVIAFILKGKILKTEINKDGVYQYKGKRMICSVSYQEISRVEATTTLEDRIVELTVNTLSQGRRGAINRSTVNLYNEDNEVICKLSVESIHELPLVLCMLATYGSHLEHGLSVIEESHLEEFAKNRIKGYKSYEKYLGKSPIQIFLSHGLSWIKGVGIVTLFIMLFPLIFGGTPFVQTLTAIVPTFFILLAVASPIQLLYYSVLLSFVRCYK